MEDFSSYYYLIHHNYQHFSFTSLKLASDVAQLRMLQYSPLKDFPFFPSLVRHAIPSLEM